METINRSLFKDKDYEGLRKALAANPQLANEGIGFDEHNTTKAHPLHRICDGVYAKLYSDEEAVEMAKIFLARGANVNGFQWKEKQDTPLIAAASLQADQLALLYIDEGATIHYTGCHGGTALHWAAWCGRDVVVKRLLQENADISKKCIDFESTPLFWAIHGYKHGGEANRHHQVECARLLVQAGAEKNTFNFEGCAILDLLGAEDTDLRKLLS